MGGRPAHSRARRAVRRSAASGHARCRRIRAGAVLPRHAPRRQRDRAGRHPARQVGRGARRRAHDRLRPHAHAVRAARRPAPRRQFRQRRHAVRRQRRTLGPSRRRIGHAATHRVRHRGRAGRDPRDLQRSRCRRVDRRVPLRPQLRCPSARRVRARRRAGMTAGPFGVRLDVKKIPLSVLELAPVTAGADTAQALQYTTELAHRVEELGYRRIWVAEHHNMPAIASSSPAVLIAHLAAVTSTIRVGSGGVMLPNHAPLVVAEPFGTLASLHPGRIDLGVGRAPGTDQRTALALRRTPDGLSAENFPSEFADVVRMLAGDPSRLQAVPAPAELPEIWLLGSSGFSAQLAGELGLPFSFAHHFSAANTEPALELYRRSFRPSQWLDEPHTMVAVNAVCADTDERAELLERTGADELMLTNQVYGIKDRMRSYELIAELAVA